MTETKKVKKATHTPIKRSVGRSVGKVCGRWVEPFCPFQETPVIA